MMKVDVTTNYKELKEMAKQLGLQNPTGKSKEELVSYINTQMEATLNGTAAVSTPVEADEVVFTEGGVEVADGSDDGSSDGEAPQLSVVDEDGNVQTTGKAPRVHGKWFEQSGANPYNANDVVEVTSGPILVGRHVVVTGPSNKKKNAIKGYLVNPKTNELQGTHICLAFDIIKKVDRTPEMPFLEGTNENNEVV